MGEQIKEKYGFTDEYGNSLAVTLKTVNNTTNEEFIGYTIYEEYDTSIIPTDEESGKAYNDANKRIYQSAKDYYAKNPPEPTFHGKTNKATTTTAYLRLQSIKYLKELEARGEASPLARAYLKNEDAFDHDRSKLTMFSKEQLEGKTPLDAPKETVAKEIKAEADKKRGNLEQQVREAAESAKRGEESLRNRMENRKQTITITRNGDGNKVMRVNTAKTGNTFNSDEVQYMISRKISQRD